jgi:hypothetical protein
MRLAIYAAIKASSVCLPECKNINAVLYIHHNEKDRNTVIDSTFVCAFLSNT